MKDKEKSKDKEKDHDKEREPAGKSKKSSPSKKLKAVSKRSAKIEPKEDEPELDAKIGEPDEDDLDAVDLEPDEDDEDIDLEEDIEELDVEEEIAPAKAGKGRRSGRLTPQSAKNGEDPAKPQTRLGLIRARHESMKREIEQIREDLDSDEEE